MPPDLRLRPLNDGDEAEALAAHAELAADDFSLDHDTARPWAEHVQLHRWIRCGVDLPADRVRGAFLLATTGDDVVGGCGLGTVITDLLWAAGVRAAGRPGAAQRVSESDTTRQKPSRSSPVSARSTGRPSEPPSSGWARLKHPRKDDVYALTAARIQFIPFQFRPLPDSYVLTNHGC